MKFRNIALAITVGITSWIVATPVKAENLAEFFSGRAITIHMGFPGGGFLASAQLVGTHMGKYIPGNPKIVFSPRPGRTGTAVLDFIAQWAPKDGTHLAMPGSLGPWMPLLSDTPIKYDPLKLVYIGNVNSAGDTYLFTRADAGIKSLADLKIKSLRVSNARGAYRNFVAALNNILGTKITYIGDYPAHRDAFIAMIRGNTQGVAGAGVTIGAEHRHYFPNLLKDGEVIPILRYSANTKSTTHPNVPIAGQSANTETQKKALEIVFANQVLDRPIVGPPGMSSVTLKVFQDAFMRAMKDPALIAEAKAKKLGIESPMSGIEMKAFVLRIFALPNAAKSMAKRALRDSSFVKHVKYSTFKAQLMKIKPKGKSPHAVLLFKSKEKSIVVHLDARTTILNAYGRDITIPPFKLRSLTHGMICEISWTGHDTTAHKLTCGD